MLVPDGRQKCLPDPWLCPPNLRAESPMSIPRHGSLDHSHGLLVRGSEAVKEPLPELPRQTPGSASVSSTVCRKSQSLIHFLLCSKQLPSKKLQCWSLLTLRNNLYIWFFPRVNLILSSHSLLPSVAVSGTTHQRALLASSSLLEAACLLVGTYSCAHEATVFCRPVRQWSLLPTC